MDNTQAQIQVGSNHQAKLPPLQADMKPEDMPESCAAHETLVWRPDCIVDGDLLMYLRAARSMAAFVGWCDGGSTDDGCAAASMDETTVNALNMLHEHDYDTGQALQALVKVINPKSVDKRWSDDDAKRFGKGLKQYGKNFFKIRKDLLSNKETCQLIEYYYLWKKTPAASTTRPHRRHRRQTRRQAPTPTLPNSECGEDMSSVSEGGSEQDSEEEGEQMINMSCHNCRATKSDRWFKVGKEKQIVCSECHKYAGEPDLSEETTPEEASEPPPFMFRPVKEEELDGGERKRGGRGEGRVSPSVDSTCSSVSSSAKEIPNVCQTLIKEDEKRKKMRLEAVKASGDKSSSPSGSYSSSAFGNDDNEQDGDVDNNQDEGGSSGTSSNLPSPVDTALSKATASRADQPTTSSANGISLNYSNGSSSWPSSGGDGKSNVDSKPIQKDPALAFVHNIFGDQPWFDVRGRTSATAQDDALYKRSHDHIDLTSDSRSESSADDLSKCSNIPIQFSTSSSVWSTVTSPAFIDSSTAKPRAVDDSPSKSRAMDDSPSKPRAVASVAPTHVSPKQDAGHPLGLSFHAQDFRSYPSQPPPDLIPVSGGSRGNTPPPMLQLDAMTSSLVMAGGAKPPSWSSAEVMSRSQADEGRPRSRSPHAISDESDQEVEIRSPSPPVKYVNVECFSSSKAIFRRRLDRGYNSCCRTDIEFQPVPGSKLAQRLEERARGLKQSSLTHSSSSSSSGPSSVHRDIKRSDSRREEEKSKKSSHSPPENRSSDAQITSSLLGGSHGLHGFGPMLSSSGPSAGHDRLTSRYMGHDPTPALTTLSQYAKPHNFVGSREGAPRAGLSPYSFPPPSHHGMEQLFRMPGLFPGPRMDLDMDKREAWERERREIEFLEKMKEIEMKPGGFDRMTHSMDPLWLEYQRRLGPLALAVAAQGGPGIPPGPPIPGLFPPGNIAADLIQRERIERERMELAQRTGQEQQLAVAAAAAAAAAGRDQLFQRYAHDPGMLQRQLNAFMTSKAHDPSGEMQRMLEASHLVYHFARADPLASAGSSSGQGSSGGNAPPHSMSVQSQGHHQMIAREQERMYLELLSRPPYSTDPILAQQLTMAAQQEALHRHLALERECMGGAGPPSAPPGGPMMLH